MATCNPYADQSGAFFFEVWDFDKETRAKLPTPDERYFLRHGIVGDDANLKVEIIMESLSRPGVPIGLVRAGVPLTRVLNYKMNKNRRLEGHVYCVQQDMISHVLWGATNIGQGIGTWEVILQDGEDSDTGSESDSDDMSESFTEGSEGHEEDDSEDAEEEFSEGEGVEDDTGEEGQDESVGEEEQEEYAVKEEEE